MRKNKKVIKYYKLVDSIGPIFEYSHSELITAKNIIEVDMFVNKQTDHKGYPFERVSSGVYDYISPEGAIKVTNYYGAIKNVNI